MNIIEEIELIKEKAVSGTDMEISRMKYHGRFLDDKITGART